MDNSWHGWFVEMVRRGLGSTEEGKVGGSASTGGGGGGTRELGLVFDWFVFVLGGRVVPWGGREDVGSLDVCPESVKSMASLGRTVEEDGRAVVWMGGGKDGRSKFGRGVCWSSACEGGLDGGRSSLPPSGEAIMAGQSLVNGRSTLVKVA